MARGAVQIIEFQSKEGGVISICFPEGWMLHRCHEWADQHGLHWWSATFVNRKPAPYLPSAWTIHFKR